MPRRPRIPLGRLSQLLLLVASFVPAAYAGVRLLAHDWFTVALWIAGAALLHDLVLLPLYATADRAAVRVLGTRTMYLRAPAVLSGLLLLIWSPQISGTAADRYRAATALTPDALTPRWALLTATFFTASGLLLTLRLHRAGKPGPPVDS